MLIITWPVANMRMMGKRSRSGEGKEGKDWGEPGPRGGWGRLWRRRATSLWRRRSTSWTPCRWRSVGRGVEGEGHLPLLPQGLLWITVWKLVLPFAKVWSYEFGLGLYQDGLLFEALSNWFYIWGCCLLESWLVTEPLPISALQSRLCARTRWWNPGRFRWGEKMEYETLQDLQTLSLVTIWCLEKI